MKKLIVFTLVVFCVFFNINAQILRNAIYCDDPGEIGPDYINVDISESLTSIKLSSIRETYCNEDQNNDIYFCAWQRSFDLNFQNTYNSNQWEFISLIPHIDLDEEIWYYSYAEEKPEYNNPEYNIPVSELSNDTYDKIYYRRISWRANRWDEKPFAYRCSLSDVITVNIVTKNGGEISPEIQEITNGDIPESIINVQLGSTNVRNSKISYGWEHSTDKINWQSLTTPPTNGSPSSNHYLEYQPSILKGKNYYRRITYETNTENSTEYFIAYSNIVEVNNVIITSPGTIKFVPSTCDISTIHITEDSAPEYSNIDGCDFIHGYEISTDNSTWQSIQISSEQAFEISLPYESAIFVRRWMQDNFDQEDGIKQYTNTVEVEIQVGTLRDNSYTLCENYTGNLIAITSVLPGNYYSKDIKYQWQISLNNSTFGNEDGMTSEEYFKNPGMEKGSRFLRRNMYLDGCTGEDYMSSETIEVRVNEELDKGTITSAKSNYCYGEDIAPINITMEGEQRVKQFIWKYKEHNGENWIGIGSNSTLDLAEMPDDIYTAARNGNGVDFIRSIHNDSACTTNSDIFTINIPSEITSGIIGDNDTICSSYIANDIPKITQITSSSGGLDNQYIYSWEYKNINQENWNIINEANNLFLSFDSNIPNTRTYRRKTHDACLSPNEAAYSNEIEYAYKTINISLDNIEACVDSMFTINAPSGFRYYYWNGSNSESITLQIDENDTELSLRVVDYNGCEAETTATITPFALPDFTMEELHICEGTYGTSIAPEGYVKYYFDNDAAIINNEKIYTYEDAELNSNRTIQVVDTNACKSKEVNYKVSPEIKPNLVLNDAYICRGEDKDISINYNPSYQNIIWSDDNGVILEGVSVYTINVNPDVTTNYYVTIEDEYCSSSASMTLFVRDLPEFELRDTFACYNDDITLIAEDLYSEHYWSRNNNFNNRTTTITILDTIEISLRVVDLNGCENTKSMTITMKPLPLIHIEPITACEKDSVILSAPKNFSKYLWDNGDTRYFTKVKVKSFNQNSNHTLNVQDEFGCSSETTAIIYTNPIPTDFGISTQMVCENEEHQINAKNGYSEYYWSNGDNGSSIIITADNDTSMYLKVTNEYNCSDSASFNIRVFEIPKFDIADTSKCNDGIGLNIISPIIGDNYYWSNNSVNQTAEFNLTTDSEVWLEVHKDICSYRDTFFIEVLDIPIIDLPDTSICYGDSLIYTPKGNYADYVWNNGQTGTLHTKIIANKDFSLHVTDNNGCVNTDLLKVTKQNLPIVYITSENSICQGEEISLSVASSFAKIEWSTGEITPSISHTLFNDSLFYVNVEDVNGCKANDNTLIIVNDIPQGQLSDTAICKGNYAILQHPGNYTLNWSTGASGNNILFRPENDVNIYLTLTDLNNCVGYDSMYIDVKENPHINIPSENVCQGDSILIESPTVFKTMSWSTGDTTSYTNYKPSNSENIYFNYTDDFGCSGETSISINMLTVTPFHLYPQTICQGESTQLAAPIGFDSYLWSNGETTNNIIISPDSTSFYSLIVHDLNGCHEQKETYVAVNKLPEFNIDDKYLCKNTSTTIAGPNGNYSYLWSTGLVSKYLSVQYVNPGIYNLQVIDKATNCKAIEMFTVYAIAEPQVNIEDSTICQGQYIHYELPSEYSYIWPDGSMDNIKEISPLSSTDYNINIIDTFNCISNTSFNVTVFTAPILDVNDNVLCNENTISLNVPYAEGFEYIWFNGEKTTNINLTIDSMLVGWIRAENINCSIIDSFQIVSEILPEININDVILCFSDSALVSLPKGYNYNWSTGDTTESIYINELNKGQIFATITSKNNCEKTTDFNLSQDIFNIDFNTDSTEILLGSNLELRANSDETPMSYSWLINEIEYIGEKIIFSAEEVGYYNVSLKAENENGCIRNLIVEDYIRIINTNTVDTNNTALNTTNLLSIKIYPNPSSDILYLDTRNYSFNNSISYSIIDISGKIITDGELKPQTINNIDVKALKNGAYYILLNVNGFISNTKFIKID